MARSSGIKQQPHFLTVYGQDGVGKTSFAAGAPKPLFLDAEGGTKHLNVERDDIGSYKDLDAALSAVLSDKVGYSGFQTVVFDSLDWLVPQVYAHVCATVKHENGSTVSSIEGYGYGKGYVHARAVWQDFIAKLARIRDKGLNVVLLAHAQVYSVDTPETTGAYKQFDLKLPRSANNDIAALFREACDTVAFMSFKRLTPKDDIRALDGGRVLRTQHAPGWAAKNRFGLPEEIPLPDLADRADVGRLWAAYSDAVAASQLPGGVDKAALLALAERVTDANTKAKAIEAINGTTDSAKLAALAVRLNKVIEKGAGSAPAPIPAAKATTEEI